jgi:hypothetical protein
VLNPAKFQSARPTAKLATTRRKAETYVLKTLIL